MPTSGRLGRAPGGVTVKGIAAPHPLRQQGLPGAPCAAGASSLPSSSASHDPPVFSRCMRAHRVTDVHGGPGFQGGPSGRAASTSPRAGSRRPACRSRRRSRTCQQYLGPTGKGWLKVMGPSRRYNHKRYET
jgi:hypothetical protein